MTKVTTEILKKMDEHQTELTGSITDLLQTVCKAVKEVRLRVDYRPALTVSHDLVVSSEE